VQTVVDVKQAEDLGATEIVLITDAAGLDKADVKLGLEIMDAHEGEVWGKLDAGTEDYFKAVNRTNVKFQRILDNLLATAKKRPIIIQSLFLKVHGDPMSAAELESYCDRLQELSAGGGQIREVHLYTVARPTPEAFATKLELAELESMAATVRERTGLTVAVFP
jgi:wyosine [tRNA(Phe)-imidazoG37] synthetase (radical SAM superfamily)